MAQVLGIPCDPSALLRWRDTPPRSVSTASSARRTCAARFGRHAHLERQRVLLIDDVFTTGATLQDCARAALEAGARGVYGLTVTLRRALEFTKGEIWTSKFRVTIFAVTEALDSYVQKKLERLDRYLPNIMEVRVELGREHTRRGEDLSIAQITVRHQRGAILRAQETIAGEIEAAINLAVDKMYRQIQRFKGKRDRAKGASASARRLKNWNAAEAIPEVEVDGDMRMKTAG